MMTTLPQHNASKASYTQAIDPTAKRARRLLAACLLDIPARVSLMTEAGDAKYRDIAKPTRDELRELARDHLAGRRTIAATLATDGMAIAGCRDYDAGGEPALLAALQSDQARGIASFAFLLDQGDHPGGHVWRLYDRPAPARDIAADLATLPGERGELYPSGNAIRLPFGYHRRKRTRGMLLLQDGRRFDLEQPAQLDAGILAVLDLPRNDAPPAAPESYRHSTGSGATFDPDNWQNVPDGAALLAMARYRSLFQFRPQLATQSRGERVIINGDDSDSMQVAVLIANLITTCRKGCKPGEGAPPPEEIRAIALAMKDRLRPDYDLAAYKADVDRLMWKYKPASYAPEPTRSIGQPTTPAASPAMEPAQHKPEPKRKPGRPAGSRQTRKESLVRLLAAIEPDADGRRCYRVDDLAAQLHACRRTVSSLLADLAADGTLRRGQMGGPGGLPYVIWDANNYQAEPPATSESLPESAPIWDASDSTTAGITTPQTATENTDAIGSTHAAPYSPTAGAAAGDGEPITLAGIIAAALDSPAAQLPRCRWPVVRALAGEHFPDARPEVVRGLYAEELERRHVRNIRTANGLRARLRDREARIDAARAEGNARLANHWRMIARVIREELATRPPVPQRKRRKIVEALPDPRKAGEQRRLDLEATAAAALDQLRGDLALNRTHKAASGPALRPPATVEGGDAGQAGNSARCVPPIQADGIPDAWSMIERLKARRAVVAA